MHRTVGGEGRGTSWPGLGFVRIAGALLQSGGSLKAENKVKGSRGIGQCTDPLREASGLKGSLSLF